MELILRHFVDKKMAFGDNISCVHFWTEYLTPLRLKKMCKNSRSERKTQNHWRNDEIVLKQTNVSQIHLTLVETVIFSNIFKLTRSHFVDGIEIYQRQKIIVYCIQPMARTRWHRRREIDVVVVFVSFEDFSFVSVLIILFTYQYRFLFCQWKVKVSAHWNGWLIKEDARMYKNTTNKWQIALCAHCFPFFGNTEKVQSYFLSVGTRYHFLLFSCSFGFIVAIDERRWRGIDIDHTKRHWICLTFVWNVNGKRYHRDHYYYANAQSAPKSSKQEKKT